MKRITLICFITTLTAISVHSQSKKELIAQLATLKTELRDTKSELNTSKTQLSADKARMSALETQMKDLQETNTSLLSNMSGFTALSKKKAENLESSLQTIKEKDRQLKVVTDQLTKGDSLKLATLTKLKNTLKDANGKSVEVGVANESVLIAVNNESFFGSKIVDVTAEGKTALQRIAQVINNDPEAFIIVEGRGDQSSVSGKIKNIWDLSAQRATSIVNILEKEFSVPSEKMVIRGVGEATNTKDPRTRIVFSPLFQEFYNAVKESMKNSK